MSLVPVLDSPWSGYAFFTLWRSFVQRDSSDDSHAEVLSEDRAEDVVRVWAILENDERKTGELMVRAPKTRLGRRCCVSIARKGKDR